MKRHIALKALSIDHHHGLVLARKAKKAACQNNVSTLQAVWSELQAHADQVLISHFEIEEKYIAAVFSASNDPQLKQLANRLNTEHTALRRMLSPHSERSAASLQQLAQLLEQHIRFEEREFFEIAQIKLDDQELLAIYTACASHHEK